MQCAYNGMIFNIARIDGWRTQAILSQDRSSFIMWHHVIQLICVLNWGATAVGRFAQRAGDARLRNPQARGAGGAGNQDDTPPTTYKEILLRLADQRKRLTIWMDSGDGGDKKQVLLDSPMLAPGNKTLPSDALHGPQCMVNWVIPDGANSSLSLGMEFQTWLPVVNNYNLLLIDHRWTFTTTHDEDYFATHVITGNATFNVGALQHAKLTPDTFRGHLLHKVPLGFQRTKPEVTMYPDGSGFDYQLVDVEKAVHFPIGQKYGATRITIENSRDLISGW